MQIAQLLVQREKRVLVLEAKSSLGGRLATATYTIPRSDDDQTSTQDEIDGSLNPKSRISFDLGVHTFNQTNKRTNELLKYYKYARRSPTTSFETILSEHLNNLIPMSEALVVCESQYAKRVAPRRSSSRMAASRASLRRSCPCRGSRPSRSQGSSPRSMNWLQRSRSMRMLRSLLSFNDRSIHSFDARHHSLIQRLRPWQASKAVDWDSMTLSSWLDRHWYIDCQSDALESYSQYLIESMIG